MAGVRIEADVDSAEVRHALDRLVASSIRLRPVFDEIGAALLTSTQQRFEDEEDPDGEAWAELAESTKKKKIGKRKVRGGEHKLRVTSQLFASLTYLADDEGLGVGSNKVYAALHQMGGTDEMPAGPAAVPARPFLGVDGQDEDEIVHILEEHFEKAVGP